MAGGISFSSSSRLENTVLTQRSIRAIIILMISTLLLGACGLRLAQLQLVEGHRHRASADRNRIRMIPIASDRGNILDHKGRLLAANRLSRSVYLWPREQSQERWQQSALILSKILKIPGPEIQQKLTQIGYHSPMPVRIVRDISPAAFTALAEQAEQLPGVEIRAESSRIYPHGSLAAHVLGYIGEATEEDLKAHPNYPIGIVVGQMGVERIANAELQGSWGDRLVETDVRGRELQMLGVHPPVAGSPVQLTIDLDLQRTAEKALGNRRGAVVVLDVKTGAVLALASGPTFDPNLFTRKMTTAEWKGLQNPDKPFLNRALQGYPPGSTFKVVTAVAGMESGKFAPDSMLGTYAYINLGGHLFHEHGAGYGVIGFSDAFAVSSNTFFYQVGLTTGPEQISKWAQRLGIGEITNLGLEGESHGLVPTPTEKQKLYGEPWYGGDTVSMAIGQGLVQVSPLELTVVYATIANGGWRVKPHLLASQTDAMVAQRQRIGLKSGTIAVIRSGLIAVVQQGTASQLNDGSIPLTAGKTGTAEVLGQRDNALYVGFGPARDPQIAVAVVVENGGFGAESAVPIAHQIYKTYFKTQSK
ncbi:penicillin-binding protein 2 [Leptolyngbya sp. 'hensonii']|uniref:penicillin-binding protein 2 n=1 Tax=Leptolyngbya sp. 'hensonii' TaxID=1922337 RepID=UPI00094FD77B|nr:penicillin-binding protein 2 [Leptolyngbya sp. 'hensonii']OLP16797.1 penicillin-binding protein 2 [Leptolyngbya sp. 'hensonii']